MAAQHKRNNIFLPSSKYHLFGVGAYVGPAVTRLYWLLGLNLW